MCSQPNYAELTPDSLRHFGGHMLPHASCQHSVNNGTLQLQAGCTARQPCQNWLEHLFKTVADLSVRASGANVLSCGRQVQGSARHQAAQRIAHLRGMGQPV